MNHSTADSGIPKRQTPQQSAKVVLARLKPGAAAKLVSINVGQTIQYVISQHPDNLALSFVHDPLEVEGDYRADPSHSLIKGLPVNDGPEAELVKDLLVDCIQARYPAKVKAT